MSLSLFTVGRSQFFDSNGDPLNGGLLYTYEPGTTTNKATYTDKDGTEAHANPIVLDSRGEKEIWLDGTYKFVLKDSAGATIWTADNHFGIGNGVQTGYLTKNVAGAANVTLTAAEWANSVIEFTGILTGNITVYVGDSLEGYRWILKNSTTGSYTLTVSTTSGSGVAIDQSSEAHVYSGTANIAELFTITSFAKTLLDDATAAAARTTLAVPGTATTNTFDLLQTFTSGIKLGTGTNLTVYEEGTFTPIIVGSSSAGTGTYTLQAGRYTTIGNRVWVHIEVAWTAHTGSGNLRVGGLPFTSTSTANANDTFDVAASNLTYTGSQIYAAINTNSTQIALAQFSSAAAISNIALDTAATLILTGAYEV